MNIIKTKEKDLGDGFIVRRALPSSKKQMVGPFIFWDHMGPADLKTGTEMLVRQHPHIGISTLTYLFSGCILHRDSLNNECLIKPGEVNWMTAGNGITHSERSQEPGILEGIQLWVALPQEHEEMDAKFEHYTADELPKFEANGINHTLIAGHYQSYTSPVQTFSPLFYIQAHAQSGAQSSYSFDPEYESAIYVASGKLKLKEETLSGGELAVFTTKQKIELNVHANTNFMIFGGKPFAEGRHIWWNFVASDREKIERAKLRWQNDQFTKTFNEPKDLRIPLPAPK
ncbi:MAG TPA: pirin family protein [Oligoflexia bacterium]|nr:pirin family protein [Oligoflexia bacterium]HMR24231.1 pirin family protein [Oligoflexia bacterium]